MASSWATFGLDLHLELGGHRRGKALEDGLRRAITDGRLAEGSRLPSSRQLAADLGVARNTVVDVYDQLTAEGWLTARRGSGTAVAARPPGTSAPGGVASGEAGARETAPQDPGVDRDRPWRHDLRPGGPDLSSFPRQAWLAASRRAWHDVPDLDLGYGDPCGTRQLREALAGYLGRTRGVRAHPSTIVVCSGFTQAFGLLCRALRRRGPTTMAVERYGLPELHRIAADARVDVALVPVDGEGADLAGFGAADAAVLTPAHQFPLGHTLSPRRRHAALAWARAQQAVVIEDDYDGEFRYDRDPIGALQGLDPDHVVYVGTASKTLMPGLRLAWLVLPADLLRPVVEAKLLADRHTSVLEQLTLAEFIASGAYDRHVRRRRLAYRRRRDDLVGVVGADRVAGVSAGLHALVDLPAGLTEPDAVAAAATRGLAVEGLDDYRTGPSTHRPALVVGYATPPDHAYRSALSVLLDVLAP